ncbi:Bifunctional riboflavin biosynthesis protein RIBA 1, chloroplastic [Glycine max]|nr:Bifunctional riboflavin biosynthesis protein RIBA 1, chloroplastic [Glycine max]
MNQSLVFALLILRTFVRIYQTLNGFRQFSLLFHVPAHMFQYIVSGTPPLNTSGYKSDFMLASPIRKVKFSFKVDKMRAVISGEGDLLSHPNNYNSPRQLDKLAEEPIKIRQQLDTFAFGTVSDEINPTINGFFADRNEYDLDCPTQGFSSIPDAIADIRQGKLIIVVDDEDRENEGDLIMAASMVTPKAIAFIVKYGTGIVCVSMKEEDLERLQLPLMVTQKDNGEKLCTAFTVTVDAKQGTTTGVSAQDRATTILKLASRNSRPDDFNRPGHIFPLKYREGGVLKRPGHTEASVDLAVLAGLEPATVLCEIVDDDGSMARLPKLRQMAKKENLKIISIADLIRKTCNNNILRDLGVQTIRLMTKYPAEYDGLKAYGLAIAGKVPLLTPLTGHRQERS